MTGLSGNTNRKYKALTEEQENKHLALLRAIFVEEGFGEQTESFFKAWIKALGQEFYIHKDDFTPEYRKIALSMAEELKPQRNFEELPKGHPIAFQSGDGYISVTNNEISFEGSDAQTADLFKMAFLASRDKDMIKKGVELEGNLYQRAILEMSLVHIAEHRGGKDPIIKNLLTDEEAQDESVANAIRDFESYKTHITHIEQEEVIEEDVTTSPSISLSKEFSEEEDIYTEPPKEVTAEKEPFLPKIVNSLFSAFKKSKQQAPKSEGNITRTSEKKRMTVEYS